MEKLQLTKRDITSLVLLLISFTLLSIGASLKNLLVIAGVAGLVIAWLLCIDNIIANQQMNLMKRIVFGGLIVFIPIMFALYLGS